MKRLVIATLIVPMTGCSTLMGEGMFVDEHEGRFLLSADKAGLQEFGKAMNGLVVTGKAEPNTADSYFENQDKETQVRTFRFRAVQKKGDK